MPSLPEVVGDLAAQTGFSGVVAVHRAGVAEFARAYGYAHRAHQVPNTVDTRFALASGAKGFTALTVARLVERGVLRMSTTARSVLGDDLALIDDGVTVEHLLAHRSGIGDYLDEDAGYDVSDYVMPVPVHTLLTTEQYLAVLDGHPAKFPPGERFSYGNGGYVVLALIAERASGVPFHDLVDRFVCVPAGMADTGYPRSDELPGRTATGYLSGGSRSNVLHMPVRGSGDGGIYSTVADLASFWTALFAGQIVGADRVADVVRPRSDVTPGSTRYGLGFWLRWSGRGVFLEGYDAGVSFRSAHDPDTGLTHTVVSNTSDGAWPLTRRIEELLGTAGGNG